MTTTTLTVNQIPKTPLERSEYFRAISSKYTNDGFDRIKRHGEYTNHPETISSKGFALTTILAFGFSFAKIGKEIGKSLEKAIVKDETEGDLGGLIGGATGFMLGVGTGGYAYMNFIEHSPNYQAWIKLRLDNSIKEALTFSYSNDEVLENFCCPISLCIMTLPSYTPHGHLFDYEYLINCPKESNGKIKDPNRAGDSFKENEIIIDYERSFILKKRLQLLLKKDLEILKDNPEAKKAISTQLGNVERTMLIAYEKARANIEKRRKEKIVTTDVYEQEMKEFKSIFGIDENQELDWSLDWPSILQGRFKHFHPDAKVFG